MIVGEGDSGEDFIGYEPTTTDPGWLATLLVVILCLGMNLSLPLLVRVVKACQRRKEDVGPEILFQTGMIGDDEKSIQHPSDPIVMYEEKKGESNTEHGSRYGDRAPRQLIQGAGGRRAASDVSDSHHSVKSTSSSASFLSIVLSSVLETRPSKGHKHHYGKKTLEKNFSSVHNQGSIGMNDEQIEEVLNKESDDLSICNQSIMSTLDHDAVSVNDAADAKEGTTPQQHSLITLEYEMGFWNRVFEIAEWDFQTRRLVTLFIPYFVQALTEGTLSIVQLAIIGHFLGGTAANAFIMVTLLVEFTGTFTHGFAEAVGTLGPQAHGAGNSVLVGRYLQLAAILYFVFSIPGVFIWSFWTDDVVLWFGFDQETADLSQKYAFPYLVTFLMSGLEECVAVFLDIMGHEKYAAIVVFIDTSLETALIVTMASMGVTNLVYIAIAQAVYGIIFTAINFSFIYKKGWFDAYWEGLVSTLSLRDGRAVHTMTITALPLSIAWLLTYGEWEVLTIFVSFMGPAEVVAWGILGFLWDAFEETTAALADAAEVRVGFHMGAGQPRKAEMIGYKALYLGLIVAMFSTSFLFVLSPQIPMWLTPDPTLQKMIFDVLPLIGFGQILLNLGTVCWGIVGAQGRVRLATTSELLTSWFVVIPLSAIFTYTLNYNLLGPVIALVFGYTAGGLSLAVLILTSDWQALSKIVISRNGKVGLSGEVESSNSTGPSYDDYDWADLPPEIKEAAIILGYTKQIWDNDGSPSSDDKYWHELTEEEVKAAKKFGYTKETWNQNSDSDSSSSTSSVAETNPSDPSRNPKADVVPEQIRNSPPSGLSEVLIESQMKLRVGDSLESVSETHRPLDCNKEISYDDLDWTELPSEVQAAATVLGYDQKLWDNGGEPDECDKYWRKLTKEEQEAAVTLGYDQQKWDSS